MLDSKRVIKIIIRYRLRNYYINILLGFFTVQIWKDFILGWWKALASAWFPGIRHFENSTLWIPLRLGLRHRAWKATNGHSRKLAWLSMTIFSKFWSHDCYPICIHGSGPRCFSCIAEQVTWEVLDMFSRGGQPLACHFANASVEMVKFVRSASKTMSKNCGGLRQGRQASSTSAKLSNFCKFVAELIVHFHTILCMNSQRSQLLTSQLWLAQIGAQFHVFLENSAIITHMVVIWSSDHAMLSPLISRRAVSPGII